MRESSASTQSDDRRFPSKLIKLYFQKKINLRLGAGPPCLSLGSMKKQALPAASVILDLSCVTQLEIILNAR